jgi:hypothetical protein
MSLAVFDLDSYVAGCCTPMPLGVLGLGPWAAAGGFRRRS